MHSGPHVLNQVSWWMFLGGLVLISVAYLSATFGGKIMTPQNQKNFQVTISVGTIVMYISLLLMPAVPLWYRAQEKSLNKWDWTSAFAQWAAYGLLPLGLYWWKLPTKANAGAAVLVLSLLLLLGSGIASSIADKMRILSASKLFLQKALSFIK
jgi:hypothetical protein